MISAAGHCIHCGLPVTKVPPAKQVWTKQTGEPEEEWVHAKRSVDGVTKCDKHFLRADEVISGGSEVPVQD